jgi:hypothetical protein
MAIVLVQVNTWHTKRPEKYKRGNNHDHYISYGDYYLLNTNRMVDIKVSPTGGTVFKYNQAPDDSRASYDTIETNSSVADLRSMHDGTPTSKFAVLSVYNSTDFKKIVNDTPVTTEIAWDSICLVMQTVQDGALNICRLVYFDESFKRKMIFIDCNDLMTLWATQGILP